MSAVDGTGGRGLWLTLAGPYGERTLLAAILSDETGLVDFSAGALPKRRVEERLRALRAESPLPWVAVPPGWAWATLVIGAARAREQDHPVPAELSAWIARLGSPAAEPHPIHALLPASAEDGAHLERSAALLGLPELAGWFLDPASLASDALEWLGAQESRLVVSDQIKAERLQALEDRVLENRFDEATRRRWQARLEDQAYVLLALGRVADAAMAVAVARAVVDPQTVLRRISFFRALVERSLQIAGEVATGRMSASAASRAPRGPAAPVRGS
jgi:hypothetical protein